LVRTVNQIQVSGPTIDNGRDKWHPSGATAVVIGVSSGRNRRHRATAFDVHDAVDDLVVDAVAARGNDQRSPDCCRIMGELACVAWVTSRLQGDRHVRQLATKIIPHALGQG
jgi:hypothetical protein